MKSQEFRPQAEEFLVRSVQDGTELPRTIPIPSLTESDGFWTGASKEYLCSARDVVDVVLYWRGQRVVVGL